MKAWMPVALGVAVILTYALFYSLSSADAGSIGLVNSVGLVAVFVGLVAAGLLLRRATPHQ